MKTIHLTGFKHPIPEVSAMRIIKIRNARTVTPNLKRKYKYVTFNSFQYDKLFQRLCPSR